MPKEADAKGVASWDLLLGPQPSYKHLQPQQGTVLKCISRPLGGLAKTLRYTVSVSMPAGCLQTLPHSLVSLPGYKCMSYVVLRVMH
jgi:hypothetical protein